jgi:hypothetical protein
MSHSAKRWAFTKIVRDPVTRPDTNLRRHRHLVRPFPVHVPSILSIFTNKQDKHVIASQVCECLQRIIEYPQRVQIRVLGHLWNEAP